MAEHKKNGACRQLIVTGCMAERYRDELKAEIPEIDVVLGTGEVPEIVKALAPDSGLQASGTGSEASALIQLRRANGEAIGSEARSPKPGASTLPTYIYDADTPRLLAT